MKKLDIWKPAPHEDNFTRAQRYLSLRLPAARAARIVQNLRDADVEWFLAGDVLRAARLEPLTVNDPAMRKHVLRLLESDHKMHPALIAQVGMRSEIADGYHAVSLAAWLGPAVGVPCLVAGA